MFTGFNNPSGLVRLVEDHGSQFRTGMFHAFSEHGLSPRLNMLREKLTGRDSPWLAATAWPGIPRPERLEPAQPYDGQLVFAWHGGTASKSAMQLLQLNLSTAPSLAGRSCYFAVKAAITSSGAGLALMVDRGDGQVALSSDSDDASGQWRMFSTQATLLTSGVARFGVQVFGASAAAQVATAVVAPVGVHYADAEE